MRSVFFWIVDPLLLDLDLLLIVDYLQGLLSEEKIR